MLFFSVCRNHLMTFKWPRTFVEDSNCRFGWTHPVAPRSVCHRMNFVLVILFLIQSTNSLNFSANLFADVDHSFLGCSMEYFEHDRRVNMKTYPLYTLVFKNSSSEFESAIMRNFIEHNFPVETINFEANAVKSFCERSTAMSIRRDFVWFYSEEFLHSFIDLSNCKTIDDSIHIIANDEIDNIDLVFEILERFFNHNIYLIVQVERIFWRVYSRMPEELMRDVGNLDSVSLLQNFWWNGIECYYESLHETFFQSDLIVSSIIHHHTWCTMKLKSDLFVALSIRCLPHSPQ